MRRRARSQFRSRSAIVFDRDSPNTVARVRTPASGLAFSHTSTTRAARHHLVVKGTYVMSSNNRMSRRAALKLGAAATALPLVNIHTAGAAGKLSLALWDH